MTKAASRGRTRRASGSPVGAWIAVLGLVAACMPESTSTALPSGTGGAGAGGAGDMAPSPSAGASGAAPLAGNGGLGGAPPMPVIDAGTMPMGSGGSGAVVDASVPDGAAPIDAGRMSYGVGFVGEHGPLRVSGNRVVDAHGEPIQLRGMSFFWTQWTDFYVASNVDVLIDAWGATVVRVALGVENDGGYLSNPQPNIDKVRTVIDRAIARGVYVIIDWHDHHAQDHADQARSFFEQMARDYGAEPSVIFEVYNEPMDVTWPVIKTYAEDMIQTIRNAGSSNLIVVGTPTWSQDVDVAAANRIATDDNVAYTLHFYAATHNQLLRSKAARALNAGVALFVTEWGTCSADGNGTVAEAETQTWLTFLRDNSISWANWSLHDKDEACSAIASGSGATGPWRDDQLTTSGRIVKAAIP